MVRCVELFSGLFLYKRLQLLQQQLKRCFAAGIHYTIAEF